MSDEVEKDEKTEDATPHRLEELRKEGRGPRSADVGAAAALLAGLLAIAISGAHTARSLEAFAQRALSLRDVHAPGAAITALGEVLVTTALPIVVVVALAALVVGIAQGGGHVMWGEVAPDVSRLDPSQGIRRVLPGLDTWIELGKTMLKVVIIGFVAWRVLERALPRVLLFARSGVEQSAHEAEGVLGDLAIQSVAAFAAIAALDGFLAWRKFLRDARMTKQQVKDEHKQQEGDPQIKARRRARARQMVRQRAIGAVKDATVLVTNPTHIAIALRYDPARDAAPVVLAKGVDELALRMREEARKHRVPIVENRPLARTMHATAKVGRAIPVELYEAIAGVIAHVMRIRGGAR